ncbi:hypothetical protein RRG08_049467 [Elysia crispata]|uniref:Uncharacterized protein n=1 Tax=Elysia crispata TaxID=231223 RepID=A0AAE0ZT31_9GAST|nr:hypothetical protein RRG08_049467 [Elysia crispata]
MSFSRQTFFSEAPPQTKVLKEMIQLTISLIPISQYDPDPDSLKKLPFPREPLRKMAPVMAAAEVSAS